MWCNLHTFLWLLHVMNWGILYWKQNWREYGEFEFSDSIFSLRVRYSAANPSFQGAASWASTGNAESSSSRLSALRRYWILEVAFSYSTSLHRHLDIQLVVKLSEHRQKKMRYKALAIPGKFKPHARYVHSSMFVDMQPGGAHIFIDVETMLAPVWKQRT